MIKIYGSPQSSGFRCFWTMEELGIKYETMPLDLMKGENESPEYLKLNPTGKIPTIVDGEFALWESEAIVDYVVEKNGSDLGGSNAQEKALVHQWSLWGIIHLNGAFGPLAAQKYRDLPDSDATKQAREQDVPRELAVLDAYLAGKKYLVSDRFTVADINVGTVLRYAEFVGFDISSYKNVSKWFSALCDRPAMKKLSAE